MKFYVAMLLKQVSKCLNTPPCPQYMLAPRTYIGCPHKQETYQEYQPGKFHIKIGQAKAAVTRHQNQYSRDGYVLVGDTDDMQRIDADAQMRYEHAENRSLALAAEAQVAQLEARNLPVATARKRKPRKAKQ